MKITSSKFFVGLAMFIAFAFLVALFIAGFLIIPSGIKKTVGSLNGTNSSGLSGSSSQISSISLTAVEVSKHNSAGDCWMIINGKVYDLTSFINLHSGGSSQVLQYCGKDGSAGYNTKDGQGSHRAGDVSILQSYYIGDLNQNVASSAVQQVKNSTSGSSSVPVRRRDGADD